MDIIIRKTYSERRDETTLQDFFRAKLDGNDHGRGQVEAAAHTATNAAEVLGRLVELLITRNVITLDDVPAILDLYETEIVEHPHPPFDGDR